MPGFSSATWGPWRSLISLLPLLVFAPWYSIHKHYALPKPTHDEINPQTSLPQLSETRILAHAQHLSEGIGYRIVGTREHALGDDWMLQQAYAVQKACQEAVKTHPTRHLECEVWRQQGSGSHRFDIMGKRLYKTYRDLSNIIVRISNGTDAGKEHAVLVNAHLDSTLPSPGAADDAMPAGVMLECMRVLVGAPDWEPSHAIIFLFNNAEESLQDGSHLYSTQHETAHTVRAFINLEAAGTTGPELLFQATSQEMIEAYSNVPWPHGTIVANDIFSSGIIMSDTDFRQFELYLNITGLDMAVVGNSYLYHMRKDLVEYIEPGVAQHMADNALSLLLQLSGPSSPLTKLDYGYTRPTTTFFAFLGAFVTYSFSTALTLHTMLLTSSILLIVWTSNGAPVWKEMIIGTLGFALAFVGALVGVNVVALIMRHVFNKGMSWFASEMSCLILYGPAALAGALASHLLIGRVARVPERALLSSLLLSQAGLATFIQYIGIGSSGMYFLSGLPLFIAQVFNHLRVGRREKASLITYALGQVMPLLIGTEFTVSALDVFVPLTGRMGVEAPAEHIIASLVAIAGSYALPLAIPFAHRFGHRTLVRSVVFLSALSGVVMLAFALRAPYDAMHQKRMYVLHAENITSGERHLEISGADSAPGAHLIAEAAAKEFGAQGLSATAVEMTEWVPTWDSIYPFAAFLSPFHIDLPPLQEKYTSPYASTFKVSTANDTVNLKEGTRRLSLVVHHPGLIWTTIGFDAHVLYWSLDDNPPDEYARHHVKEASFYGVDTWSIDLVVKWPPPSSPPSAEGLKVDFVGIVEKGMYPAKKAEKEGGGPGMVLLEKVDGWLEETYAGTVDALLMCTVGGVAYV